MKSKIKNSLVTVAVFCFTLNGIIPSADAGVLWDWLVGRRPAYTTYYQPSTTAYYPGTQLQYGVPYQGAYPTAAAYPQTAYPQATYPQTAYPQATGYPVAQAGVAAPVRVAQPLAPRVARFAPNPFYRTSWMRVPVTYYRPALTGGYSATGLPTTPMAGCNTFAMRPQRVPVAIQPQYAYAAPTTVAPSYSYGCSTGCSPCGSCGVGSGMTTGSCATCNNGITGGGVIVDYDERAASPNPTYQPGPNNNYGQPSNVQPGAPQPADTQPRLKPNTTVDPPIPSNSTPPTGTSSTENGNGTVFRASPPRSYYPSKLRVVPDPDALEDDDDFDAPALIDPNDRTAQRDSRYAWMVVPISWPKPDLATAPTHAVRTMEYQKVELEAPVAPAPRRKPLNDRGWYPVGQ